MRRKLSNFLWISLAAVIGIAQAQDASSLRLIPFPKEAVLEPGEFHLNRRLMVEVSQDQALELGRQIVAEFEAAGLRAPNVRPLKTVWHVLRISAKSRRTIKRLPLRDNATGQEYVLEVEPHAITLTAAGPVGLFYGAQTIRQLIRANRHEDALPAMTIRDWPALPWRAFQDDLTRGPSSTLSNLQEQTVLGAFFKLNVFTYYMEHQFAFKKHPSIGPANGSLTPDELQAWAAFAEPLHVNILGNQQSFGHFTSILSHPEFAGLRETDYLLCPTNPQTYKLLDDLYSEVAPLLRFPYFNVCCDETDGLGEGPSKSEAQRIGVGALYVEHIRRVHDLIANNYHKRMLMWGDIILRHPDQLEKVPKDTIMLTWGYDPRPSFVEQILPFSKAGYDFVVCPGVNNWNRVLPQFAIATTNIQNFVRDGIKHGAAGMLNTAWDDDGETFNAPNWPGFAWGAECAWNASATCSGDFYRRLGGVMFGERADCFGRALEALSVPGIAGLPNKAFWQFQFGPIKVRSVELARVQWQRDLATVRQAIAQLIACQKDAKVNAGLIDYFLFGARRMELCFQRELDRLEAAVAYRNARKLPLAQALPLVEQAEQSLRASRDAHDGLRQRFSELWLRENKPYAMDWTLNRYRDLLARYDGELDGLARARANAKPDRSLPTPREVGLELVEEAR